MVGAWGWTPVQSRPLIGRRGDAVVAAQNPRRCASTCHHAKGQIHSPWTACRARSRVGITTSVARDAQSPISHTSTWSCPAVLRLSRKQVSERCVVPLIRTPTWAYRLYGNPVSRGSYSGGSHRRDIRWLRPTQGRVVEIGSAVAFIRATSPSGSLPAAPLWRWIRARRLSRLYARG